jgi:hypothetical protein
MRQTRVRLLAAVPVLALVAALPFVNRVEPLVLGLPFLLFWMLAWVMVTPAFLGAAYLLRHGGTDGGSKAGSDAAREAPRARRRADGGGR